MLQDLFEPQVELRVRERWILNKDEP